MSILLNILVTGVAGFIGMHTSKRLLDLGFNVLGIDNLNDYYDTQLKQDRLSFLRKHKNFAFEKIDIAIKDEITKVFSIHSIDIVIHLAAQAGVRYSLENPSAYIDANITGFLNILESCRQYPVKHLIYASSSSVYGANVHSPFSEKDSIAHPVSLYATTKKSNELMAHTYSHLYNVPTTGLRFFTVYGPWGRPDMAYYLFVKNILEGTPINVFNYGEMKRDFTYIDDIVEGIVNLILLPPQRNEKIEVDFLNPSNSYAPYRILNIGSNKPVELKEFILILEKILEKKASIVNKPMQLGDVKETYANIDLLQSLTGFKPSTTLEEGLRKFVEWYRSYYL